MIKFRHLKNRALQWVRSGSGSKAYDRMLAAAGEPRGIDWDDENLTDEVQWRWYNAGVQAHRQYLRCRILNQRVIRDDGESITVAVTIKAPSRDAAIVFTENNFGETHCKHSYDCCGHWYSSTPKLRHVKRKEWLIIHNAYLNI